MFTGCAFYYFHHIFYTASHWRSAISFMSVGMNCFFLETIPSNQMPSLRYSFRNASPKILPAFSPSKIIFEESSKISVSMT